MRLYELCEAVFTQVHVFDSEAFAELHNQLTVSIDKVVESGILMHLEQLCFDVDLDRRSVDDKVEGKKYGWLLEFEIEHWYLVQTLVQEALVGTFDR